MRRLGRRDEERRVGRRKGKRMWRDKKRRQERIWNTIFLRDIVYESIPNRMGTSYYHIMSYRVRSSRVILSSRLSTHLFSISLHHTTIYTIIYY